MNDFVSPTIEWGALAPALIVAASAVIAVLVEAFAPRKARRPIQLPLALLALAGALVAAVWRWTVVTGQGEQTIGGGQLIEDRFGLATQFVILVCAMIGLLVIADRSQLKDGAFAASTASRPGSLEEREAIQARVEQTEVFPLTLFAVTGMMVFPVAGDLLTLFIALEVLSLPLYVLSGMARRKRLISQEAALKYFLLGAFSSAFFLMGIALLYGYSGSVRFADIMVASSVNVSADWLLITGVVLVLIGLLFKVGAVPFHAWTPDVYQGAPTPVTGFMAACTKIAAFGAMLRFLYVVATGLTWDLEIVLTTIVVLTVFVGTVMGLVQNDVKRMLAYSSIAHAGFILIGVMSFEQRALSGTLVYLLAYGLATVGAFAVITLVREENEGTVTGEATSLSAWAGLGKRHPLLAGAMLVFLLSFAGIPLTGGFTGKFVVFAAGIEGGHWPLVLLAILASVATAFFYFRLAQLMFFTEPGEGQTVVSSEGMSLVAIVVCVAGTLALGVVPQFFLSIADSAAVLLP